MISRWARTWVPNLVRPLVEGLHRAGITPNLLTLGSLLAAWLAGGLVALGYPLWAALAWIISGLFDSLDGELARFAGPPRRLGSFLDSICDHYGDFGLYLGLLWQGLQQQNRWEILLVFLAMFGSLAGSQIRSRAGMLNIDTKNVGAITRMERTLILLVGLVSGQIVLALAGLAVAVNFSALQRLVYVLNAGGGEERPP